MIQGFLDLETMYYLLFFFLVKGAKESICFQKSVSLVFKYL